MLRRSWPFLLAVLFTAASSVALSFLIKGPWGWLLLAGLAAAAWAAVAFRQQRLLEAALARVAHDLELASKDRFGRWVLGEDWGPLAELAPSFNWLLQEVQAALKALDDRLSEETARLEALVHAMPDGIIVANLRGEVLYVNAPAARMTMRAITPRAGITTSNVVRPSSPNATR